MKQYLIEYFDSIKKFSDFEGKSTHREFLIFLIVHLLIIAVLSCLMLVFKNEFLIKVSTTLLNLYLVCTILPSAAIVVRRLHHLGRRKKLAFTAFVPVAGILYLLIICLKGQQTTAV
jgi:uncharacterized membrane protein YhaH (DUF805 family)